jgi:hypothetical protein
MRKTQVCPCLNLCTPPTCSCVFVCVVLSNFFFFNSRNRLTVTHIFRYYAIHARNNSAEIPAETTFKLRTRVGREVPVLGACPETASQRLRTSRSTDELGPTRWSGHKMSTTSRWSTTSITIHLFTVHCTQGLCMLLLGC